MTTYQDLTLDEIENLAYRSDDELQAHMSELYRSLGGGTWLMPNSETALFLASSRSLVLELTRRIREVRTKPEVESVVSLGVAPEPPTCEYCGKQILGGAWWRIVPNGGYYCNLSCAKGIGDKHITEGDL